MARVFAFFRYTGTMLRGVERERIKNDRHLSFLAMTTKQKPRKRLPFDVAV